MGINKIAEIIRKIIEYSRNICYVDRYQKASNQLEELKQQHEYLKRHINAADIKKALGYERQQQMDLVKFVADYFASIKEVNIRPFLIAGSLVGQYRYGGFVPWDDDMDFGLMRTEYEHFVNYCKCRYPYYIYEEVKGNLQKWVDDCTKANAGKYILFIYENQIQISYGTNVLDRKCIDFFSFDYFSENVSFDQYNQYLVEVEKRISNHQLSIKDKYEIVRNEIATRKFTIKHSGKVYFGLDNMECFKRKFNEDWIKEKDMLPFVKRYFEGYEFWTPRDIKAFLKYEYPDFEKIPDDVGIKTHGYWEDYIISNYVNVEFYLVDAFEIDNLVPFYNLFRKNGARAVFIAERQDINIAGKWFDYEAAIKILETNCLEYKTKCNKDAQIAFTTQDVVNLSKYSKKTKRVNCSYGYGLISNSYAFCKRVVEGFDYKLCNGNYQRRMLERLEIQKVKLFVVGMPKYFGKTFATQNEIIKQLGIHTTKKILVYLPTWDENCCVEQFYEQFIQLREKYYIVTKMHHVLERMDESKNIRMLIRNFSDCIVESTYSLSDIVNIADLVVADAKSGASLEAVYLNNSVKAVFLSNSTDVDGIYLKEIHRVAPIVTPVQNIMETIKCNNWGIIKQQRNEVIEDCYGNIEENYAETYVNEMMRMLLNEKCK